MKYLKIIALTFLTLSFSSAQAKTDWTGAISDILRLPLVPLAHMAKSLLDTAELTARALGKTINQAPGDHAQYLTRIVSAIIMCAAGYGILKGTKYVYKNVKELFKKHPEETKKLILSILAAVATTHAVPVAILGFGSTINFGNMVAV